MVRTLVIDAHADTLLKKYYATIQTDTFIFLGVGKPKVNYHVTKELLIQGGVNTQIFALYVPTELENLGIEITLEMIALARQMEKEDGYLLIKSKSDLHKVENQQELIGMVLSMEGTLGLDRNLRLLPLFYELGVRCIGLTWSRKNLFAEGIMKNIGLEDGEGLSVHGKKLLEEMENLGILVDISHLNR
ncbi:MAG: dipeptidase, partial [Candidatus Hodarchaeota archaeon]